MPRRRLLTDAQRANLLALPTREAALIRHFTLAEDDLALVATRKHPETKLGLALQLCALRYPGRLLRPGELIPAEPLAFIAEQVGVPPDSLAGFARRGPTRYEQLGLLYRTHGFQELTRPHRAELAAWLLPIARETTAGLPLVEMLLGEMRRRLIVVPGISVVERLAAAVRMPWRDGVPFLCALGLFLLSYVGLGINLWPLVVPPEITIWICCINRRHHRT